MTINVDKQWFVDRWTEKGLSLRKVAGMMQIDPSALSRMLNGERGVKVGEVAKIATALGVSKDDVLSHIGAGDDVAGKMTAVPAVQVAKISEHPQFGFMKGLIKLEEGFDIAGPYDDEVWDEGYLGDD